MCNVSYDLLKANHKICTAKPFIFIAKYLHFHIFCSLTFSTFTAENITFIQLDKAPQNDFYGSSTSAKSEIDSNSSMY